MDLLSLFRTIGGLGAVLGILAGALWLVRRYDLRLPGRAVGARARRLELVETLPVDARRMIALVRRDGREHLVLLAPEGHLVLETALVRDAVDQAADDARRAETAARNRARASSDRPAFDTSVSPIESFAALVDRVRGGVDPVRRALEALRDHAIGPPPDLPPACPEPEPVPRRKSRARRAAAVTATSNPTAEDTAVA